MTMLRPARMIRATLAVFGVIFLPFAIGFLVSDFRRSWPSALVTLLVSVVFLWLAIDRSERSLVARLDDPGAAPDE
jgi:hypothetical protein